MHFHPTSATFQAHPEWACAPVGHGLAALQHRRPDERLERGRHRRVEPRPTSPTSRRRIRERDRAVGRDATSSSTSSPGSTAPGQGDLYDMHDAFVAMLDRLRADHPHVTFQIDETNDYRLFPFESVTPGPVVVPERLARARPPAAQPLEPEPVRPVVVARPAHPRRRRVGDAARRHADGRRAAVPHHLLQRPALDPARR